MLPSCMSTVTRLLVLVGAGRRAALGEGGGTGGQGGTVHAHTHTRHTHRKTIQIHRPIQQYPRVRANLYLNS